MFSKRQQPDPAADSQTTTASSINPDERPYAAGWVAWAANQACLPPWPRAANDGDLRTQWFNGWYDHRRIAKWGPNPDEKRTGQLSAQEVLSGLPRVGKAAGPAEVFGNSGGDGQRKRPAK